MQPTAQDRGNRDANHICLQTWHLLLENMFDISKISELSGVNAQFLRGSEAVESSKTLRQFWQDLEAN